MSNNQVVGLFTSKDRVKATRQLVSLVCTLYFDYVTKRELDLLCEFVNAGGVCREAKNSFQINYKASKENTAQILTRLTHKKILVSKPHRSGRQLNQHFTDILEVVQGKKNNKIIVTFDAPTE